MKIEKIKEAATKYIGKHIIYYEQIDSTQTEAKKIEENSPSGTIVIAERQKTRKGNQRKKMVYRKQ